MFSVNFFSQLLYGNPVPPPEPRKISAETRSPISDFAKYRIPKKIEYGRPTTSKKMVRYQCINSGDGTERLIEEGTMSHKCPHCIYDGKPDPFIYLDGMVCPIVNKVGYQFSSPRPPY